MTSHNTEGHLPLHITIGHRGCAGSCCWLYLAVASGWDQEATWTMACHPVRVECEVTLPAPASTAAFFTKTCLWVVQTYLATLGESFLKVFSENQLICYSPSCFAGGLWSIKYGVWHVKVLNPFKITYQIFMELTPQQEMDFENQDHEWMYAGEEQGPEDRWQ